MMIQAILEVFTTEQKAAAMLANPIIEFIFIILFLTFIVTVVVHLYLFFKLKKIHSYVKETNRMDIEPLRTIQTQFDEEQMTESAPIETFVQEKFSSWRLFNIPVINLIKLVQMTVSIFILIGVLGTFIGLTISLGSINSSGDQLVENVASVLSGIDVAFYTSIFGMGFSLIMTVLVKALNTEYIITDMMLIVESNLSRHEQQGMGQLIDISKAMNESIVQLRETNEQSLQEVVQSFTGFKDYTAGLEQSAKDLALFNDGLSSNLEDFQTLFHDMKTVTDDFSEGTGQLNENFTTLFSYFKKTDRRNERVTTVFEQTYEKIQEASKAQIDTLSKFDEAVNDLKGFTSSLLEEQTVIHRSLYEITEKTEGVTETLEAHNEEFKQVFGKDVSSQLNGITSYLGELSTEFDKLGTSIGGLPHALEVINQTQTEYKHLLTDRFQELKEFNQTFSHHLKDHSAESAAFEKQMREAATTYEQMNVNNNQLITEMNTTLSNMDRTFNKRENELGVNINILKDTLANYVNNVEGTLSDKLDQVVRQIGDSLELTNDTMRRELTEIHRTSDAIQQDYARSMQQLMQQLGREIQLLNQNVMTAPQQQRINHRIGPNENDF